MSSLRSSGLVRLFGLLCFVGALFSQSSPEGKEDRRPYLKLYSEVLYLVNLAYYRPTATSDLAEPALNGVGDVLDSFSFFIPKAHLEATLRSREVDTATSGLRALVDRGNLYVAGVLSNSPAERAGIRFGDIISRVDGRPTHGTPRWMALQLFSREPGEKLGLELLRGGDSLEVSLEFGPFSLPDVESLQVDGERLIRITRFTQQAVRHLAAVLTGLKDRGVKRMILDLRGSFQGEPEISFSVADLFADGSFGTLISKDRIVTSYSGEDEDLWKGRLVILVDRATQGGAEVLAAVLRDHLGARLVGQRTFGHAGRQQVVRLPSGDALVLTTSFFTDAKGAPLRKPVEPDVSISPTSSPRSDQDLILQAGLRELREEGQ